MREFYKVADKAMRYDVEGAALNLVLERLDDSDRGLVEKRAYEILKTANPAIGALRGAHRGVMRLGNRLTGKRRTKDWAQQLKTKHQKGGVSGNQLNSNVAGGVRNRRAAVGYGALGVGGLAGYGGLKAMGLGQQQAQPPRYY